MKRPAFQFYPSDWRKDIELGACSYVARGVWFEMLCVMHEAQPYGHMAMDGRAIPDQAAANLVRCPVKAYRDATAELEANGVFSRTSDGIIYSRRMVRDEKERQQWGERQRRHRDNARDKQQMSRECHADVTPPVTEMSQLSSSSSSSSNTKAESKPAAQAPPGVRADLWDEWRKARGKRLTAYAIELQTKQLAEYGGDPNAIIEQSLRNTWTGLFPLKVNGSTMASGIHDKRAATAATMHRKHEAIHAEPTDITAESKRIA